MSDQTPQKRGREEPLSQISVTANVIAHQKNPKQTKGTHKWHFVRHTMGGWFKKVGMKGTGGDKKGVWREVAWV